MNVLFNTLRIVIYLVATLIFAGGIVMIFLGGYDFSMFSVTYDRKMIFRSA